MVRVKYKKNQALGPPNYIVALPHRDQGAAIYSFDPRRPSVLKVQRSQTCIRNEITDQLPPRAVLTRFNFDSAFDLALNNPLFATSPRIFFESENDTLGDTYMVRFCRTSVRRMYGRLSFKISLLGYHYNWHMGRLGISVLSGRFDLVGSLQGRSPRGRAMLLIRGYILAYGSLSHDSGSSTPSAPIWVEPLDPESYARSQGIFPTPSQITQAHTGYQYNSQTVGPRGGQIAPTPQPGNPYSGNSYQTVNPSGQSNTRNQFPPAAPLYPSAGAPHIHYGPFPGPANTVYPWTQRQLE
ncbi:hypothetical protein K438DRAFT_2141908 [Mycena galopus ATCC 62051]|nr:hypothetical protein K438DRAFT_2141908 [Mycena galopus ATCC 62051]